LLVSDETLDEHRTFEVFGILVSLGTFHLREELGEEGHLEEEDDRCGAEHPEGHLEVEEGLN